MSNDTAFHPHVYATPDGERSTAGSNYGDWRPTQPQRPHGYDFESRFRPAGGMAADPADLDDPRLREPHALQTRYRRFEEDFDRWRAQHGAAAADTQTDPGAKRP